MDRSRTADKTAASAKERVCISQEEVEQQERELRSKLESALKLHGSYSQDEIDDVMKSFKYYGLKAIEHLKHVSEEKLTEKGIPLVTAKILKEEFSGAGAQRKKYTGDAKAFWRDVLEFLKECCADSLVNFIKKLVTEFVKEILPVLLKGKGRD